jgi:hypothetical protein
MAGDWLKFEINTPEKREVLAITIELGFTDPDLTVGKLLKVWRWFDQQTINGNATNVTPALLDRLLGVSGITQAMANVGWMVIEEGGLTLPNFERHNGRTAKNRVLTAKRVANYKSNARGNDEGNDEGNDDTVSKALPREEKRREDINTIHKPKKPRLPKKEATFIPDDFGISENVRAWAEKNNHTNLELHLEYFISSCKAKGYQYIDWDSAFRKAIVGNWAKVSATISNKPSNPFEVHHARA